MIVPTPFIRLVMTTAGSREQAERIATALVEAHLAACVNTVPGIRSVYSWQEEVETAEEVLLLIKTTAQNLDAIESTLRRLHSYELPELVVLEPEAASEAYANWINRAARPADPRS